MRLSGLVEDPSRVSDWVVGLVDGSDVVRSENGTGERCTEVGLELVVGIGAENRNCGGDVSVGLLEKVRDEVGLMSMVESRDGKFELVGDLEARSSH